MEANKSILDPILSDIPQFAEEPSARDKNRLGAYLETCARWSGGFKD